jgi:phospholipid/cholesterol/gamma-HCH transport system substrate-binding protein
MKMHYSHRLSSGRIAQIVGAFVVVPLIGLIVVGIFMAKAEHLFEEKYLLHAGLSRSYGLEPGAPVLMAGISIGRVKAVEFSSEGRIDVTLQLLSRYRDMVRQDSVATFSKSGLVAGQTQVEISMGKPSPRSGVLEAGASITTQEPIDYVAKLNKFADDVTPLLESVQRTLQRVDDIVKDVQGTVQTGGRVLTQIEQSTKELPTVMASVQRSAGHVEKATASLPDMTGSVKKTLSGVDGAVADIRKATGKLPAIMDQAQEAVANIKATTESIKGVSRDVPSMVRSAQQALDDVNTIISGAKRTFPVSTMVKNAPADQASRHENGLKSLRGDQLSR